MFGPREQEFWTQAFNDRHAGFARGTRHKPTRKMWFAPKFKRCWTNRRRSTSVPFSSLQMKHSVNMSPPDPLPPLPPNQPIAAILAIRPSPTSAIIIPTYNMQHGPYDRDSLFQNLPSRLSLWSSVRFLASSSKYLTMAYCKNFLSPMSEPCECHQTISWWKVSEQLVRRSRFVVVYRLWCLSFWSRPKCVTPAIRIQLFLFRSLSKASPSDLYQWKLHFSTQKITSSCLFSKQTRNKQIKWQSQSYTGSTCNVFPD